MDGCMGGWMDGRVDGHVSLMILDGVDGDGHGRWLLLLVAPDPVVRCGAVLSLSLFMLSYTTGQGRHGLAVLFDRP